MKRKAFLYIILAGILWGTSGIFVRLLSPYGFSSLHMTTLRGLVSFLCLLVYLLLGDRRLLRVRPKDLLFYAASGLALFGTAGGYFASMQLTSISTAVVLMYTAPVLVMIFSVAFLGERLTGRKAASVLCMSAGCCLVSGIVGGFEADPLGIALGLLSGVSYGSYNILTKLEMQRGSDPLTATLYSSLFMSLFSMTLSRPWEMVPLTAKAPAVLLPLMLCLGVVTFVLPYLFYNFALKELPAGTASALSVVEPMAATIFGVLIFREALDLFSAAGILLILFAVFLLSGQEKAKGKKREGNQEKS